MNVLSLFDGISCGHQALDRSGIKVDKYFASEIDKYAIAVTMANYPETIQLGNVVDIDGYSLPKIDLLIGGSPCQSFSFAGKRKGMSTLCEQEILTLEHYLELKINGFEFEGQSYLFWEFMRLLNEVKPKYFLLENVEMGEKWEKVLRHAIQVPALHINSALVSAQNRKRVYFTNIGMQPMGLFGDMESIIKQPKDKGILLKDVLEDDVPEKYFLSDRMIESFNIKTKHFKDLGGGFCFKPSEGNNKGRTITNPGKNRMDDNFIICSKNTKREIIQVSNNNKSNGGTQPYQQDRIYDVEGIAPALSAGKSDFMITSNYIQWDSSGKGNKSQGERAYFENGKSGTLSRGSDNSGQVQPKIMIENVEMIQLAHGTNKGGIVAKNGKTPSMTISSWHHNNMPIINSRIRRLTPLECKRLQTIADDYKMPVSDSQIYKQLGNGWTIDVIAHIFSYIK